MLVDQEKRKRVLPGQTETETAEPFVEIGEQPAFAVQILKILDRRFEALIVPGRAWRDALAHQSLDAVDEGLLLFTEAEIHGTFYLASGVARFFAFLRTTFRSMRALPNYGL
jgi:hypothetical protein